MAPFHWCVNLIVSYCSHWNTIRLFTTLTNMNSHTMWKCAIWKFNVYSRHESISKIAVPSNGCYCESTTWFHFANIHINGAEKPKQLFPLTCSAPSTGKRRPSLSWSPIMIQLLKLIHRPCSDVEREIFKWELFPFYQTTANSYQQGSTSV